MPILDFLIKCKHLKTFFVNCKENHYTIGKKVSYCNSLASHIVCALYMQSKHCFFDYSVTLTNTPICNEICIHWTRFSCEMHTSLILSIVILFLLVLKQASFIAAFRTLLCCFTVIRFANQTTVHSALKFYYKNTSELHHFS